MSENDRLILGLTGNEELEKRVDDLGEDLEDLYEAVTAIQKADELVEMIDEYDGMPQEVLDLVAEYVEIRNAIFEDQVEIG
tara:strand:+ start:213 stop:455 length:243 start_codon:yes stop_codon:yes gene_type:complete